VNYLFYGFASTLVLTSIYWALPAMREPFFMVNNGNFDLYNFEFEREKTWGTIMFYAFIQVALAEELAKLALFKIGTLLRGKKSSSKDTLFATMFYMAVVGAGFAMVENIKYIQSADSTTFRLQVMTATRAILPSIAHILLGLLMGYFLALSRLKNTRLKKATYVFFGIFMAVLFHGFYDYLLMSDNGVTPLLSFIKDGVTVRMFPAEVVFLVIIGVTVAYIMGNSLSHYSSRHDTIRKKRNLIHQ